MSKSKSKNISKPSKALDSGRSQSGLRAFNEQQILGLIRRLGSAPKAVIAAETGLSAQAVTVIINKLETSKLVKKLPPQRGKIGQPSIPFSLNPDGAYSLGLNIERRGFDLTLIDFTGNVRGTLHETCAYPKVDALIKFVEKGVKILIQSLADDGADRVAGIGVAMPFEIWRWSEEFEAQEEELNRWKDFNIEKSLNQLFDLPVFVSNDDTAACAAELSFGNLKGYNDFLYMFIGAFIGGGIVINGYLQTGSCGNAGAIGSMPITIETDTGVRHDQLIQHASINTLDKMLKANGQDTTAIWQSTDEWGDLGETLDKWIDKLSTALCTAALCGMSIFDFEAIYVEGAMPSSIKAAITESIQRKLAASDLRGLSSTHVIKGSIGGRAQSIGSATLPLITYFSSENGGTFR